MACENNILFEACVDSLESARNAQLGGAGRLELCSTLQLGGLTPTAGLLSCVKNIFEHKYLEHQRQLDDSSNNSNQHPATASQPLPVFVMIRPRDGDDFQYDADELEVMERDIIALKESGADGFVFGCLTHTGHLDIDANSRLLRAAHPLPCTFHRAFDVMTTDPFETLDALIRLGFRRLLTSGRRQSALDGAELIGLLRERGAASIVVMAGAGVKETNAASIIRATGCIELHGSASVEQPINRKADPSLQVRMGTAPESVTKRITSADAVKRIIHAIQSTGSSSSTVDPAEMGHP